MFIFYTTNVVVLSELPLTVYIYIYIFFFFFFFSELRIGENPILSDTDRIVGRLLHLSTIECESLPKAWYTLAGWCYKWGRKAVDNAR